MDAEFLEGNTNGGVSIHHEQVAYSSKKWRKLGFDRCEFWSSSKKVGELVRETGKTRVFIVW